MEQVVAIVMKVWVALPGLMESANFWVSVSFVGLVSLLIYYRLPAMLARGLDAQREAIARDLAEAQDLYSKAQALLDAHEAKRQGQLAEAEAILAQAKRQAADYQTEQTDAQIEKIARLETQATQRIEQEKKLALETLHRQAMAQAQAEAQKLVLSQADSSALIDQSITEIETSLKAGSPVTGS